MSESKDRPVPIVDPQRCNGCGLCVHACPAKVLVMQAGRAVVAHPLACNYTGGCETVCPVNAITRPFEIVLMDEKNCPPKPAKICAGRRPRHRRRSKFSSSTVFNGKV